MRFFVNGSASPAAPAGGGAGYVLAPPVTSSVNPVGFNFSFLSNAPVVHLPGELAEDSTVVDYADVYGWEPLARTAVPANVNGGSRVDPYLNTLAFHLNAGESRQVDTKALLQGSLNGIQLDFSYAPAAASVQAGVALQLGAGQQLLLGASLGTDRQFVCQYNNGAASTALVPLGPSTVTTQSVVKTLVVGMLANFICLVTLHADGTRSAALYNNPSVLDLGRTSRNLTMGVKVFAANNGGAATDVGIQRLRIGKVLGQGDSNQRQVKYVDGTPYQRDGELYFTTAIGWVSGAIAGQPPAFSFATSHLGVYSVNQTTGAKTRRGQLYFEREGGYYGEGIGQLLLDPATGLWHLAAQSYGNLETNATTWDCHIWTYTSDEDVLHGTHGMGQALKLDLENTGWVQYDPAWVKRDGAWYVMCAEKANGGTTYDKPYHIACFKSTDYVPGVTAGTWARQWTEAGRSTSTEGPNTARINGVDYVWSSLQGGAGFPCYEVVTGIFKGIQPCPILTTQGYTPHFCLLQYFANGQTQYLLNGFNGNLSPLLRGPGSAGYEFPLRPPIR